MRIRSTLLPLAIPALAVGLVVSGCSSGGSVGGVNAVGAAADINPQPVDKLRDGGNLREAIGAMPENYNALQVNGNTSETVNYVLGPVLPETVTSDAAGNISTDHNYFTDIKLMGTNPQKIVYTINPKAVWSDGSPITWEDMRSEAEAMNGKNPDFQVSATSGYDRIASVERGVDDRQAVVTMAKPYASWQALFSPLYPKAYTATPQAFNTLALDGLPISGGPFIISNIDRTQNRITLSRNPKWWGPAPKLDTITLSVLDSSAVLGAVQNNEIDWTYVSGLAKVVAAKNTPGVVVRRTAEPTYNTVTFNGAKGSILEDPALRVAISKAIDRQAIVTESQHGIVDNPKPLNNHIFMAGQKGYQDNSAAVAFDPQEAAKELDALGWKLNGDVREKDGRKLELRDVMYNDQGWIDTAKIIQQDLAKVGVKMDIQTVPGKNMVSEVEVPGNFDLLMTGWVGNPFPLSAIDQIYSYFPGNVQGNFGRIGTPELNDLINKAMSELDPAKAIQLANQADEQVWKEGFSLTLNQASGTYATRSNLANIGAFGLSNPDWTKVGFLK